MSAQRERLFQVHSIADSASHLSVLVVGGRPRSQLGAWVVPISLQAPATIDGSFTRARHALDKGCFFRDVRLSVGAKDLVKPDAGLAVNVGMLP